MKKRTAFLMAATMIVSVCFSGCKIDVNQLVGEVSENESVVSEEESTAEDNTEVLSETNISETDEFVSEIDFSSSQPDNSAFDTSAYKTVYISGSSSIPVIKDEKENSEVIGELSFGESVSFINSSITNYSFIYSETLSAFGYVADCYLVDDYSEVSYGQVYYSKTSSSQMYEDENASTELRILSKNEGVTVIAMLSSGMWRVVDKNGIMGYVSSLLLSEEQIKEESSSSKPTKKNESRTESKAESKSESKSESKTESKSESTSSKQTDGRYVGEGEAPSSDYSVYIVDVDVDYLALRSEPSADGDVIIGALYYEEQVYVLDSSGEYWYVYAPSLGMYGFVNGDPNYLYAAQW